MYKTFSIILLSFSFILTMAAQPPQEFKYQGIVRDNAGNPLRNKQIALRINILQQSETGNSVYTEKHYPTTNQFGLFNINVGAGEIRYGRFDTLSWNSYNYFQKVEIDTFGTKTNLEYLTHYVWMGTSQLLSVPYSLASNNSNRTLNNGYEKMWVFDIPGQFMFMIAGGEGNYMIETWGAGGGGFWTNDSVLIAGGGGAYAKSVYHFKNGDGFFIQVGKGGKSGMFSYPNIDEHGDGGTSFIDNNKGILVSAGGGEGGFALGRGGSGTGQLCTNGQSGEYGGDDTGNSGGNSPNGGFGGYYGSAGTSPGGGGGAVFIWLYKENTPRKLIETRLGNGANGRVVIHGQGNVIINDITPPLIH